MRTGYTMHIVLGLAAIECDVLESLVFHVWTIELKPCVINTDLRCATMSAHFARLCWMISVYVVVYCEQVFDVAQCE